MNLQSILQFIVPTLPAIGGVLLKVFGNPADHERHAKRSRKELLTNLRFTLSREIAIAMPAKKKAVADEDYLAQCKEALQEYLSSSKHGILDYHRCDRLFDGFTFWSRLFKYIGLPCSVASSLVLGYFVTLPDTSWTPPRLVAIASAVLLLLVTVATFLGVFLAKDRFDDLCSKYEVTGEEG